MSGVTHTLTLRALTSEAIDQAMAAALVERGATVILHGQTHRPLPPGTSGEWERVTKLAKRLGLHARTVSRSLHRPDCPLPRTVNYGLGGHNIVSLLSTPELDRWLCRHKGGAPC